LFKDWYDEKQRRTRESKVRNAVNNRLRKGPQIEARIKRLIPRDGRLEKIKNLITPSANAQFYSVIVGENGTGKTSLILLAIGGMDEPKGVVYVDSPLRQERPGHLAGEIKEALDFNPDLKDADPNKMPELEDILEVFSDAAARYQQEHRKIPVLVIDNANRLTNQELEMVQDYAKHASDRGIATVAFVSSEGVPLRMMGR
jgi:hypothetical protein